MLILPDAMIAVLRPFAQAFSERTWEWVQILVVGAILAPGRRTVTAILRVMGLRQCAPVSALPSRAQSGHVVGIADQLHPADPVGRDVCGRGRAAGACRR